MKPIHGTPKPVNVPQDMTDTPPVPCEFSPGDVVTYTNDYGVKFRARVRGFMRELHAYETTCHLLNPDGSESGIETQMHTSPDFIYLEFWCERTKSWRTEGSAWWCAHRPESLRKSAIEYVFTQ